MKSQGIESHSYKHSFNQTIMKSSLTDVVPDIDWHIALYILKCWDYKPSQNTSTILSFVLNIKLLDDGKDSVHEN